MESLYLLIPLSAGLILFIVAVFGWAVFGGQFESLEAEAERILTEPSDSLDADQGRRALRSEQSTSP
ncbi:MAG: cbb3-type cytochrome oxidase assembly protein CcoS [Rubrivivax sp.]|jgi:cbb3-type cytochrome oxidase maturation protein